MCCVGARQAVLAWFCGLYLFRELGGGGQGDVVAELFELTDEESASSFWLVVACEVVGAELVEGCFVVLSGASR